MRAEERLGHIRFESKRRITMKMIALLLAIAVLAVALFVVIKIFKLMISFRY